MKLVLTASDKIVIIVRGGEVARSATETVSVSGNTVLSCYPIIEAARTAAKAAEPVCACKHGIRDHRSGKKSSCYRCGCQKYREKTCK